MSKKDAREVQERYIVNGEGTRVAVLVEPSEYAQLFGALKAWLARPATANQAALDQYRSQQQLLQQLTNEPRYLVDGAGNHIGVLVNWDEYSLLVETARDLESISVQPKDQVKAPVSLQEEPFIGMWQDREDLVDSSAWVRQRRRQEWGKTDE